MKKITIVIPLSPNKRVEFPKSIKDQSQKIELIIEKGTNTSRNRNEGIKKAKTEFVAFINAHTLLSKNWSDRVMEFFDKHPEIDIVGGPQLIPINEGFFEKVSGYALSSFFGTGITSTRYNVKKIKLNADETDLTTANLICRRKIFRKVLFDERLYPGEDPKFILDAKKSRFRVAYSPDIVVYNKKRSDLTSLARQIYGYALARPKLENKISKRIMFSIPSLFLLYLLICPILYWVSKIFIVPLITYIFLNLVFSMAESLKNNNVISFFILPFIFLTIHISYGLGFIKGVFKK